MDQQTAKNNNTIRVKNGAELQMKRDIKALRAIRGIWHTKKIMNPVLWQKKIRKEWQRTLP